MRTIFHISKSVEWERAKSQGRYEAHTLPSEGFIHMSRPHQVLGVANRLFKGEKNLFLLQVHEELVTSPIKYEGSDGELFPHIYGPLNTDAVVDVLKFENKGSEFELPEGFKLVGETLIRRGRPADEAEIASCHTHAWQESYKGIVPNSILENRPLTFRNRLNWWRSVVNGETPTTVFVAESARHGITGFCASEPARDASMMGKGEIAAIYCLNAYKGKGIGAALFEMARCELKSQGFTAAYLWVLKDNPTVGFYRKMGGMPLAEEKIIDLGGPLREIGFEWPL